MEALIPGDELVGESEPRHEAPLLQPEDSTETARKVKTFISQVLSREIVLASRDFVTTGQVEDCHTRQH